MKTRMTYANAKKLITPLLAILLIEGAAWEVDGTHAYGSPNNNAVSCGADSATVPCTWNWVISISAYLSGGHTISAQVGAGTVLGLALKGTGGIANADGMALGVTAGGAQSQASTITCTQASSQVGSATGSFTKDGSSDCANGRVNAPLGTFFASGQQQCGELAADPSTPNE